MALNNIQFSRMSLEEYEDIESYDDLTIGKTLELLKVELPSTLDQDSLSAKLVD